MKRSVVNNIFYAVAIISLDIFVYLILSLALMGYEDMYDKSKGTKWSLHSMNATEQIFVIALWVWNAVNIFLLVFVIYKFYKWSKTYHRKHLSKIYFTIT